MEILKGLNLKKTIYQFLTIALTTFILAYGMAYGIAYYSDKGLEMATDSFTKPTPCMVLKEIDSAKFKKCEYVNAKIEENENLNKEKQYLFENTKRKLDFNYFNLELFLTHNKKISILQHKYLFNRSYLKSIYNLEYTQKTVGVAETPPTQEDLKARKAKNMEMLVYFEEANDQFKNIFKELISTKAILLNSLFCIFIYKILILCLLLFYKRKTDDEKIKTVLKNDTLSSVVAFSILAGLLF